MSHPDQQSLIACVFTGRKVGKCSAFAIASICLLASVFPSYSATIVSDQISWGLGYVNPGVWNTSETSAVNVGPGVGFAFGVDAESGIASTSGPYYINGVLGAFTAGEYGAEASTSVSVLVEYTGPAPVDAAPMPNYKLEFVITNISVYAAPIYANSAATIQWSETTVGNLQSSTPITMNLSTPEFPFTDVAYYEQVAWAPIGFLTEGLTQERSFTINASQNGQYMIDGMNISGHIVLTYDAIPEPGTLLLLSLGGLVLVFAQRCSRRSKA